VTGDRGTWIRSRWRSADSGGSPRARRKPVRTRVSKRPPRFRSNCSVGKAILSRDRRRSADVRTSSRSRRARVSGHGRPPSPLGATWMSMSHYFGRPWHRRTESEMPKMRSLVFMLNRDAFVQLRCRACFERTADLLVGIRLQLITLSVESHLGQVIKSTMGPHFHHSRPPTVRADGQNGYY